MDYNYGRTLIANLGTVTQIATATTVTPSDPTVLRSLDIVNNASSSAFVQVFDALVANVTLGVTAPKLSYQVNANSGRSIVEINAAFDIGIVLAATTSVNGGSVVATGPIVNCIYDV